MKGLIIALLTLFGLQLQAQEIKTREDALKFFNGAVPGGYFYITEKKKGVDGIEKETIYQCFGYSLENEYLILRAKNSTATDTKSNSINFMLTLTDSLILHTNNYKKHNTPINSMLYLAFRNYKINYRVKDFEDYLYVKNKRSISIAEEFLQRMKQFYTAFHALKVNLDSNETADLKLAKFKAEFNKESKPKQISEEQRRYIVQANAANDSKDYTNALLLYRKALEVNPYIYPDAYYNMALLNANIDNYYQAVFAMKLYLILAPESEDARKAQDKIYEWELNIKY